MLLPLKCGESEMFRKGVGHILLYFSVTQKLISSQAGCSIAKTTAIFLIRKRLERVI